MATQTHVEYYIERKCLYKKEMEPKKNVAIGKPPPMIRH